MIGQRGILYLFAYGLGFAERQAVSLFTLRRHWSGPVLVLVDGQTEEVGQRIAADPHIRAATERITPYTGCRHAAYITKTLIPRWSPFAQTVFLDADTAVAGNVDELFEPTLALTQFAAWHTQGRTLAGRINRWRGRLPVLDYLREIQLGKRWPAINTGVIGWQGKYARLELWHAITLAGAGLHMTDELAMQLLLGTLPENEYRVFDDRYNCSPIYGVHRDDVRIWHFHGAKHLRREAGRRIWESLYREAYAANVGGMQGWAGPGDRHHAEGSNP